MRNNLKGLWLKLFYPPKCVFCGRIISPKSSKNVCTDCSNNLPYCNAYRLCRRCGRPIEEGGANPCNRCLTQKHYATGITSALLYTGIVKRAVIGFKKEYNQWMAKTLAMYITNTVMLNFPGVEFDAVVSVPPRKKPFKERMEKKYDHSAYLASYVARQLGLPYISHAMVQSRRIMKQSGLSYSDRFTNVRDNFAVKKKDAVLSKAVLLIDDVCTTGATVEECAKALKEAGAYRVYAATLARTP